MSLKYPSASGNWNTAANWNGGTIPASGDTVCANGKTIVIDMDLAAYSFVSLTTVATAPAAAGGGFTCAGAYTINAAITSGTTICLTLSNAAGSDITINGNVTGGATANMHGISKTGTGVLTLVGNVTAGGNGSCGINNTSTGAITITGNVAASGSTSSHGINNVGAANLTITGNVYGGTVYGCGIYNSSTGNIVIIGNVTASQSNTAYNTPAISNASTGTITVTGTVLGGATAGACYGILLSVATTCTVIGTVMSSSTQPGIYSAAACNVYIIGTITSQVPPTAVISAVTLTTGTLYWSGTITNQSSQLAVVVYKMILLSTGGQTWTFVNDAAGTKNLYSADIPALGNPSIADVRLGTTFGPASELTGTMNVPISNEVLLGVPNDKTTGTLIMTPAQFWATLRTAITTANSMGVYLKNAATIDSTGDQITYLK